MWPIRNYQPADRSVLVEMADRLSVGRPPWRDPDKWRTAVRSWVEGSIAAVGDDAHAMFVAIGTDRLAGFVSVSTRTHFTGVVDAYIGELVVASWAEGHGVGRALLDAAEQWAIGNGYDRLTLETGAANHRARGFYRHAGYQTEDVRLTKLLS